MKTKQQKREQALERLEGRLQRTPKEQINILSRRPGQAKKEVTRLNGQISLGWGDTRGLQQFRKTPRQQK